MNKFKRLMCVLTCVLVCVCVYSKDMKVVSGSTDVLKIHQNAIFVFEYKDATWDHGVSVEAQLTDSPECMPASEKAFINEFNKRTKGLKLVNDESKAQYKVVLKIENLNTIKGTFYRPMLVIWGTVDFIDISTGTSVCKITISKYWGVSDSNRLDRFTESFAQLAKDIINK